MVLALFLFFVSVALAVYFYRVPSLVPLLATGTGQSNNRRIGLINILDRVVPLVAPRMSEKELLKYRKQLQLAGNPYSLTPERFYAFKWVILGLSLPIGAIALLAGLVNYFFAMLIIVLPVLIPQVALRYIRKERQRKMRKELLEAIELLWAPCKAGMTLFRAVRYLQEEKSNVVIEELSRCYDEIEIGKDSAQAFKDMAARCEIEEIDSFVQAILYNMEKGAPVADFLFDEAQRMLNLRNAKAQEMGHKISAKVLTVVVLLMGPAFLILIFGPLLSYLDVASIMQMSQIDMP